MYFFIDNLIICLYIVCLYVSYYILVNIFYGYFYFKFHSIFIKIRKKEEEAKERGYGFRRKGVDVDLERGSRRQGIWNKEEGGGE